MLFFYVVDAAKCHGDVTLKMVTQGVQVKNVQKCNKSTLANICLKINCKLGGTNSQLLDKSKECVLYFIFNFQNVCYALLK